MYSKRIFSVVLVLFSALVASTQVLPSNPQATKRTRKLYANLHRMMNDSAVMFGHQDDLAYGIGWNAVPGESDVKRTVGDYPSVFGWDLGHIELDSARNLDGVPFSSIRAYIVQAYKMGSVNTISWHLRNPVTGGSAWDTAGRPVRAILPGGAHHALYLSWLDKIAAFANSLKTGFWGQKIPVIFRPFHEHTGAWFWWGETHCTADEYKALWRMTVDYLHRRGANNLIMAYSPDAFKSKEHYLLNYPGDDYVDLLGLDFYHHNANRPESAQRYVENISKLLKTLNDIGSERQKVVAITETGAETIPFQNWWTGILWQAIKENKVSYVLVWRNGRPNHYYAPYPDNVSAADFKAFYDDKRVFFAKKAKEKRLYR